jgi:hypothetical protein
VDKADSFRVDPGPLEWMIDMLHDAGLMRRDVGAMGMVCTGIGWREINDWTQGTRQDISPTWLRGMIWLSGEVASQVERSRELACPAPFDPAD